MAYRIPSERSSSVEMRLEQISPDVARSYLDRNVVNRPLRSHHVAFLKQEIRAHRFHLTGDPIKFDVNGHLMDGQHRLAAIIESGQTVQVFVARNLKVEARSSIDTGMPRTASHVLAMEQIPNAATVASCVRWLLHYRINGLNSQHITKPGPQSILTYVIDHPEVVSAAKRVAGVKSITKQGLMAALYLLFATKDENEADQFLDDLISGRGMTDDDPVFALRERLYRNRGSRRRANSIEEAAWIVKAWNARRENRCLKVFRHVVGDQAFPEIV